MISSTVVALIIGSLGMMAVGVRRSQEASQDLGTASQHARIILERMERNMRAAQASVSFPGFVVFTTQVGAHYFPDVLVVWKPATTAANPTGLPLWSELIIYTYDLSNPGHLLEITLPADNATTPDLSPANLGTWTAKITAARNGTGSTRVVLSDRLRVATPSAAAATPRGVVRFEAMLRPTAADWDAYVASTKAWGDLPWVQDVFSSTNGLRQSMCNIELQMRTTNSHAADVCFPFLGSAAVYFQVPRP